MYIAIQLASYVVKFNIQHTATVQYSQLYISMYMIKPCITQNVVGLSSFTIRLGSEHSISLDPIKIGK